MCSSTRATAVGRDQRRGAELRAQVHVRAQAVDPRVGRELERRRSTSCFCTIGGMTISVLFSTIVVFTCVCTGFVANLKPTLRLIGRLRADRVVVHLRTRCACPSGRTCRSPRARPSPRGRANRGARSAAARRRCRRAVGLRDRVMHDAAVARTDFDRLNPGVLGKHVVRRARSIYGIVPVAGNLDRLRHRQHEIRLADLPAVGELRRRRQCPPDCLPCAPPSTHADDRRDLAVGQAASVRGSSP